MIDKSKGLDRINAISRNTLMQALGMVCLDFGDDWLKIRMPVNHNTHQPLGTLHGGASAALVESVGSIGSAIMMDTEKEVPVGLEINVNHISSTRSGNVIATGKLIHKGSRTHVWSVEIHHEDTKRLIAVGRLTTLIVQRKNER